MSISRAINAAFMARRLIIRFDARMQGAPMIGHRRVGVLVGSWAVFSVAVVGLPAAQAADCPGHPDAIGTSRTIVVDPRAHPRLGTMQYSETLPLRDHEVVLTFDDGPLPKNSNQVLQILADQCVKAIFFTIGEQAIANPEGVRKLAAAGHTIATHSQTHPLNFPKMSLEQATKQIEDGFASTAKALEDPSVIAPFFRFPGLNRSDVAEAYLASKGIQVWSTDFLADDWHHISSAKVYDLAIKRLEAKGKGILLLHDIQARTVGALPNILHDLKARGYRIVQVVPATADRPATPTDADEWQLYPPSESVPVAHWPKVPNFAFAETEGLIAPALSDFESPDGKLLLSPHPFARVKRQGVPLPPDALWPRVAELPADTAAAMPVPAQNVFEMPDERAAFRSSPPPRVAAAEEEEGRGKSGRGVRTRAAHHTGKAGRVAHAAQGSSKSAAKHRASGGGKKPVRVASLKKR
jgi:peptidoglycan-N-acetylglucosamine deacetylase